jgi:hypothetical protein
MNQLLFKVLFTSNKTKKLFVSLSFAQTFLSWKILNDFKKMISFELSFLKKGQSFEKEDNFGSVLLSVLMHL